MSRIARSEKVTAAKLDRLRIMILSAFFVGMTVGLLMALGWDAAFPGYRSASIETDIVVKEKPAVADPAS
jgi:hypothetical protein